MVYGEWIIFEYRQGLCNDIHFQDDPFQSAYKDKKIKSNKYKSS